MTSWQRDDYDLKFGGGPGDKRRGKKGEEMLMGCNTQDLGMGLWRFPELRNIPGKMKLPLPAKGNTQGQIN